MYFQIDVYKEAYSVVAVGDIGKASLYDDVHVPQVQINKKKFSIKL